RTVDFVQGHTGYGAERRPAVKHVSERPPEDLEGLLRTVDGQGRVLADVERADIVEAENVIGMAVRQNNGVQAIEPDAQGLLPKIRCRVDDHVLTVAGKQQRW